MLILGIVHQHDAGAALIANGQIVAAINEERLNRQKLYWGWPELANQEVHRIANETPADIHAVAICNTTNSTEAS
ncbi:MAG: carbamoyltransferase N-terminal domain-containing protein, partial [Candidatus Latescibacterota bacterium]